jgi:hypothetical protein
MACSVHSQTQAAVLCLPPTCVSYEFHLLLHPYTFFGIESEPFGAEEQQDLVEVLEVVSHGLAGRQDVIKVDKTYGMSPKIWSIMH